MMGAFHYTGPTGQKPLGPTKGKFNASEPKLRPNRLLGIVVRARAHTAREKRGKTSLTYGEASNIFVFKN